MTLFSAHELADLTDLDVSAMADTVTIVTITIGTDAGGAPTETRSSASTSGRLRRRSARELAGDALKERGSYELNLPNTAVISGTSRVTIGGKAYRVVWYPALAAYDTARVIGLEDA